MLECRVVVGVLFSPGTGYLLSIHACFVPCRAAYRNGTLDRGLDTKHVVFVTRG